MATVVALNTGERIPIIGEEYERFEIVDGQQRLTTLIILLKAIAKSLDALDAEQRQHKQSLEEDLVKPDSSSLLLLQTNHDTSGHFARYIRKGEYSSPDEAKTLADYQLLKAIEECETFVESWKVKRGMPLTDLVTHLKNRLTFLFHQVDDEALVYSVFEVLNSRGLAVSWFDRLKSMLMSVIFEASGDRRSLIDQIHGNWTEIYRNIGLHSDADSETLRFAATLRSADRLSRVLNEEDAVKVLRSQSEWSPSAVLDTTEWIRDIADAVIKLRANPRLSAVTRVSHARLVAVAINLRKDLPEEQRDQALRRWENVTFRIYGMYGKDARTAVGNYVRLAWRINQKGLPIGRILSQLAKIGERYPAAKATEEIKRQDCYSEWKMELRYFFHRYEEHLSRREGFDQQQWEKIWNARIDDTIEHILPQKKQREYVHWLGNLMMLRPKLNSKLGGKAPREKVECYKKHGLGVGWNVAVRIEKSGKWGRRQIIERDNELLEWAAQEWAD